MEATERDIKFASDVATALRASIRTRGDDLYFQCVDREAAMCADLYEAAAISMRLTGIFQMPDDKALETVRDLAWSPLEGCDEQGTG